MMNIISQKDVKDLSSSLTKDMEIFAEVLLKDFYNYCMDENNGNISEECMYEFLEKFNNELHKL